MTNLKHTVAYNGVKLVQYGTLITSLFPDYWENRNYAVKYDYDQCQRAVKNWCKENGGLLYSRDREDFSKEEAARLAAESGNQVAVLEDLS